MIFELFDLFDIFELFGLFEFWPLCSGCMFWTPWILNSLLSTGVIVLIWLIRFELIVSDNHVQLIGYNVVAVVKCEGSNLPLALGLSKWCPRLFRWCCLFMCIFKSMCYFHKCKIALIAIKLLLFQAISLWIGLVKISNTSSLQLPLLRLVLYLQIFIYLEEFGNVTHR